MTRIMNYRGRLLCFVLICLISSSLSGQKGYISTAEKTNYGLKIVDQGERKNSEICKVDNGNKFSDYSPDELTEYGFNEKQVYRSFPIKGIDYEKRYFLELIIKSKVDIYFLRQEGGTIRYFLTEHDSSTLVEIPKAKEGYTALIGKYLQDCDKVTDNIQHIRLNKKSLARFFNNYGNCFNRPDRPLPKIKYGLILSFTESILSPVLMMDENYLSKNDRIYSPNFSFGASVDIPIFEGNLSLHSGLELKKTGASKSYISYISGETDYDMVINYSSVSLPVLLRYTWLRKGISPYLEGGTAYLRALKNEGQIYTYSYSGNNVFASSDDTHLISNNLIGITAGTGIISGYGSRYSWFAEVRSCIFPTLKLRDQNHVNLSDITFGIGFLF